MRKKGNVGITPLMSGITGIIFVLLCMIFMLLTFNNRSVKQLVYESLSDKAELYIELLEKEIVNVSQTIKVMQIRDMEVLWDFSGEITPQKAEYYTVWEELKEYNFSKAAVYDHRYSFYEYVYDADCLVMGEAVYFDSSTRPEFLSELVREIRGVCEMDSNTVIWNFFVTGDRTYLYGCFQREGKVVGCITNLDEMLEDMHITNLGYEGFLLFENDGQVYATKKVLANENIKEVLPELKKKPSQITDHFIWETYTIRYLGSARIVISLTGGVLERIQNVQVILLIAIGLLYLLILLILYHLYNSILRPMKEFVGQLKDSDQQLYLNQKENNGPLEIVYASEKFKKMYREIQSLRIDVYEMELAKNRTMLEYAQVQIRPHFFLNCMSVVQSMAELHHEEEIVHILDVLSEYMKYVLRDTSELSCVRDEIKHVSNFMDIQKLCKPDAFTFSAIVDSEVEECKILPLVLQVFAENTIKHGLVTERCIEVSVYITYMKVEEENFLYIVISDTGNGFPEQILASIEKDEPIIYDGCEHIGIRNTLKRIRMTYGEKANVKFSNMKKGYGAVVEIMLPYEM